MIEYNQFVDDLFITLYINSYQYHSDSYDGEFVTETIFSDTFIIKSADPTTVVYQTQKNRVISQDKMLYLGLMEESEREFFDVYRYRTYQGTQFGASLDLNFQVNTSVKIHYRSIYTFWDFLGDIGGLNDILCRIGSLVIAGLQLITGNSLQRYLFRNLFKIKKQSDKSHEVSYENDL